MKILVEMPAIFETETFMSQENIDLLESLGDVVWNGLDRHLTPEELRDALVDVDVLVCGWRVPKLTAEVLEKANKLRLVAYTAGSVANVVTDEMYAKGIRIVGGNEGFAESVAEGTMAHILAGMRHFTEFECRTIEGGWKTQTTGTECLIGKPVGIVGYGAISRHLLKMLAPFRVKVKLFSSHTTEEQAAAMGVQKASLEEIFSTCRVISLHCAKSDANHHLINDRLLSMMQPNALLVNTSRGDVIDEEALIRHLESGHIRASLDVYTQEPLPADSPLRTLGHRVHLQPHLGGPTIDFRPACARLVIDDIQRYRNGQALENEILPWRAKMMTK